MPFSLTIDNVDHLSAVNEEIHDRWFRAEDVSFHAAAKCLMVRFDRDSPRSVTITSVAAPARSHFRGWRAPRRRPCGRDGTVDVSANAVTRIERPGSAAARESHR